MKRLLKNDPSAISKFWFQVQTEQMVAAEETAAPAPLDFERGCIRYPETKYYFRNWDDDDDVNDDDDFVEKVVQSFLNKNLGPIACQYLLP